MISILVVDDSRLARKRMISFLSEVGVKHTILSEAEDGVEALTKYKELKPNLIITDLEMPNMDGLSLIQEIRKGDSGIDIIVVSSMANETVKQKLKTDCHTNFIKKPVDKKLMEMLLLKVEHNISIKESV